MTTRRLPGSAGLEVALMILVFGGVLSPVARAQASKKHPASKVYFAEVHGEAIIDTGEAVNDLNRRTVYNAEGTVIETKKSQAGDNGPAFSTMVYSNGTGAYFDPDTRVELKQFSQEPFTPNRADMNVEPSVSKTQAFVARGTVGLCSSKPVAGSSTTYQTAEGSVNIRGSKVVIEANNQETKISMLEGDSTVRGGDKDLGGQTLKAGQQAIIRRGAAGQPNRVQITAIPPQEIAKLDEKVSMACAAKKTVYFEVRDRVSDAKGLPGADAAESAGAAGGEDAAGGGAAVTAFDGNSAGGSAAAAVRPREIVPVEVASPNLPVEFEVSPAVLRTSKPRS